MGRVVLIILVMTIITNCHDGCVTNETRCNGKKAEICLSDNDWSLMADCSESQEVCCEDDLIIDGEPTAACFEVCQ